MSSPDGSGVLWHFEARRMLFGFQPVSAGWTAFGLVLMVKESVVRWLRSRDHINEAIARLA